MAEKLDLSLDDIIKSSAGRGRGRGRGRGGPGRGRGGFGGDRRLSVSGGGVARKSNAAAIRVVVPVHPGAAPAAPSLGGPGRPTTTLRVSNLNFRVTDRDLHELFSAVGPLAAARIERDHRGQPSGTAVVTFFDRADAMRAVKQYDSVLLDGRPLRLVIDPAGQAVTTLSSGLAVTRPAGGGGGGRVVAVARPAGGAPAARVVTVARPAGGGARGGGGGGARGTGRRQRVKSRAVVASAAELDAQMDDYMGQK